MPTIKKTIMEPVCGIKRKIEGITHRILKLIQGVFYEAVASCFPVDHHKVMFFSFQNGYACNPKYIHQELQNRCPGLKASWVVDSEGLPNELPETIQIIKRGTAQYYRELYTSGIWVDNALNVQKLPVRRKNNQFYIQTMHGSLGIKRIGTTADNSRKQKRREEKSIRLTNVAISNSAFETEVYKTSFWRNAELISFDEAELVKKNPDKCYIMELGHARSDILIRSKDDPEKTSQIRERVCRYFDLDLEKKILLWGPTFEDSTKKLCEPDYEAFCRALSERFGGEWVVIYKLHPRDEKRRKLNKEATLLSEKKNVIDGSQYMDIQELMIAADYAVTNYSSWIFDYLLTKKPGMLFVPDLEAYKDSTGFYYPIESTPFPVVRDNDEAIRAILDFDLDQYERNVTDFVQDKGCVDDGNAAQRIVNLIEVLADYFFSDSLYLRRERY